MKDKMQADGERSYSLGVLKFIQTPKSDLRLS